MKRLAKATGAGPRHFFGARESISQQKNLGRQFKAADTRVSKTKILAVMGMYAVYKGSPIGLGKNIADSIKVGRWKHSDLKRQQEEVDAFLAGTGAVLCWAAWVIGVRRGRRMEHTLTAAFALTGIFFFAHAFAILAP